MTVLGEIAATRLEGVPSYRPGKSLPGSTMGKLSANESSLGAGPVIRAAIARVSDHVGKYPDESRMLGLLADELGVDPDNILLSNGSDEICFLVASVFLGPGHVAVVGDPCYQIDATVSRIVGADVVRVPLIDGGHDLDAMAAECQQAQVVWLPSPHNPTGVALSPEGFGSFMARVPDTCLVVLDEAYRDYSDLQSRPDIAMLQAEHPNLIVQRTFSKSWAVAGLRLGYALGAADVVSALRRVRAPFSVNAAAIAAGEAAIAAPAWQDMAVARVQEGRRLLEAELTSLEIEFYPSQANFVTAHLDHALIAPRMAAEGISVRPGEDLGLPGWTRISIGWAPTMSTFRSVLRDVRRGQQP